MKPSGMQAQMQAALLRMIAEDPRADLAAVVDTHPRADYRDVRRALQLLVETGAIYKVDGQYAATDEGWRRLAASS